MKKKSGGASASNPRPRLTTGPAEAEKQISAQIEKGAGLLSRLNSMKEFSWQDYRHLRRRYNNWHDYNWEMVRSLFDSNEVAIQYSRRTRGLRDYLGGTLDQNTVTFRNALLDGIAALDSIREKLALYQRATPPRGSDQSVESGTDVFIVHGQDEAAKESVARFVEKLDFHPIILHEQPSSGRTIIEKFEDYSDVSYAVVLLTPDDSCAPESNPEKARPRARQNVIFELGFFVGRLGRDHVCVLYKEGVEIPSDYKGVIYVEMDDGAGWKVKLGQEMKEAGMDVDLNKIS